jgi:CheY-like chemotaxis protein
MSISNAPTPHQNGRGEKGQFMHLRQSLPAAIAAVLGLSLLASLLTEYSRSSLLPVLQVCAAFLLGYWVAGQRLRAESQKMPQEQPAATEVQLLPMSVPTHLRHELRTPVNLIIGFCETIIAPIRAYREPLPSAYQSDLQAIYRNAKQLQQLIEDVLSDSEPLQEPLQVQYRLAVEPTQTIALLDADLAVIELFKRSISNYEIVGTQNIGELSHLAASSALAGVILTIEQPDTRLPEIAYAIGDQIPIITCPISTVSNMMQHHGRIDYLMKPITYQALEEALLRLGGTIHDLLIVDDSQDSMEMVSRMLRSMPQGYQVWKAYSGREGLALMREQHFDATILDLTLPDIDGTTIVKHMRTDPGLSYIPVLLTSAHRDSEIVTSAEAMKISIYRLAGLPSDNLVRSLSSIVQMFSGRP